MFEKQKVYLSEEQIRNRVIELGKKITQDYQGKDLICIGTLKGSFIFFSDLVRSIDLPIKIDFLGASSYGNQLTTSGVVKITLDLSMPVANQHVLIVEDIIDTGITMNYLLQNIQLRNPASLKLCSLLLKPTRVQTKVNIDYLGFEIEDHFVVGYGLDAAEQYRNLPYVAQLDS